MSIRSIVFGLVLTACASAVSALSFGDSQGAVILGAPVDLTFEVYPDPGQTLATSCISVSLHSGNNLIAPARVQTSLLESATHPRVRVRAFSAADEPVLTATLRAGCQGNSLSRTYTFLADLPGTQSVAASTGKPVDIASLGGVPSGQGSAADQALVRRRAAAAQVPAAGQEPPATAAQAPRVPRAAAKAPPPRRPAAPKQDKGQANALPTSSAGGAQAAASAVAAADAGQGAGARLVVEPWFEMAQAGALRLDWTLTLRSASAGAQTVAATEAQQAQQDVGYLDDNAFALAARLRELEAQEAKQRKQRGADQAALAQLRQGLEQAQTERFSATVVYMLGGALLLALLALAWLMSRKRKEEHANDAAWQKTVIRNSGADSQTDAATSQAAQLKAEAGTTAADGEKAGPRVRSRVEPSGVLMPSLGAEAQGDQGNQSEGATSAQESEFAATTPEVPQPRNPAPLDDEMPTIPLVETIAAGVEEQGFTKPAARADQVVQPQDLFDVLQQAEFFVSVGEHQQAIDALQEHIDEHGEASPLAYLELLRLLHMLGRIDNFEVMRARFQALFNAKVPSFGLFQNQGRTLEAYTEELAEIEALWTSPEVMIVLDRLLFRRDEASAVAPFDLAAFDDLLLLLAVVQTTPANARGEAGVRKRTTPLPGAVAVPDMLAESVQSPAAQPSEDEIDTQGQALTVDLDFDTPTNLDLPPQPQDGLPQVDDRVVDIDFGLPLEQLPEAEEVTPAPEMAWELPDAPILENPLETGARLEAETTVSSPATPSADDDYSLSELADGLALQGSDYVPIEAPVSAPAELDLMLDLPDFTLADPAEPGTSAPPEGASPASEKAPGAADAGTGSMLDLDFDFSLDPMEKPRTP